MSQLTAIDRIHEVSGKFSHGMHYYLFFTIHSDRTENYLQSMNKPASWLRHCMPLHITSQTPLSLCDVL